MKLIVPSKEEAAKLLSDSSTFRAFSICAEALPPRAMLERAIALDEGFWCMPRLFCIESTRQVVGSGAFKSAPEEKKIEIGYGVSSLCRRRGYAAEGVWLLIEEAFASGLIEEVYAEVSVSNEASRGVLRKTGFAMLEAIPSDEGIMERWVTQKGRTRLEAVRKVAF
jgi:RimJ/RimL family protein N-acetyltransferase